MGERAPVALLDAAASARLAVAEAITNIASAPIARLGDVKLSANWMAPAGHPGRGRAPLRRGPRGRGSSSRPRSASPSRSARTRCRCARPGRRTATSRARDRAAVAGGERVRAGHRRAARAHARAPRRRGERPGGDRAPAGRSRARARTAWAARRWRRCYGQLGAVPPDLDDPGAAARVLRRRAGARRGRHRSPPITIARDGGLLVTLVEMAFAGGVGLDVDVARRCGDDPVAALFAEELGAVLAGPGGGSSIGVSGVFARHGLAGGRPRARPPARAATGSSSARRRPAHASRNGAASCAASGRRPRTPCRRCATIRRAPTRSTPPASTPTIPACRSRADVRPRRRRRRRRSSRAAARARASPSCASRGSTARSRWRPRSTAPASRRSTST